MFKVKANGEKFDVGYNDERELFIVLKTFETETEANEFAKGLNKPVSRGEFDLFKKRFS